MPPSLAPSEVAATAPRTDAFLCYADSVTHPTRRPLSRDTTLEAAEVQMEIYRRMSPGEKIALVEEANRRARALALAGLRQRHPDASEAELFRRLMDLTLGEALAREVYGPLPEDGEE
jgi:hypothetical protein